MSSYVFEKIAPQTDMHVICVHAEEKNSALSEMLHRLIKQHEFKAESDDILIHQTPDETILLLGVGTPKTIYDFEKIGAAVFKNTQKWKEGKISVAIPEVNNPDQLAAVMSGLALRDWRFDSLKTKTKKPVKNHDYVIVVKDPAEATKAYAVFDAMVQGNQATREVVSLPPNMIYPESYAHRIRDELTPLGVKVTLIDQKKLKELGCNGILAVGEGSEKDSYLVILEYSNGPANQDPLAFVGKGVTFDTGGISIKPSAHMDDMKYDMAGSGVVYGLFKTLALRKAKVNVIGALALVENMPSGSAYRPADVITSYSGQTIEVLNTDAEGRVVLADALWYVQKHFKPQLIIDLATLTGAMTVALGSEFAGIFSDDDELVAQLIEASNFVEEKLWRMPLHKAFDKDIDSTVADVQNTGTGRGAGSSTAAHFLKRFVKDDMKWAHLDIAGVAWDTKGRDLFEKGATGFGVRMLNRFIEKILEK
ncbi:MAG: leucyl aminopeptidase [Pseudomonadota bacterium]